MTYDAERQMLLIEVGTTEKKKWHCEVLECWM